ncbi:MAG TPA: RNA polymerase sigma factor [Candidatus Nealsonbacteria bacterium]|uniref:RNA polymerase sigma factor 70 region 4 type 2 domain-containing protein n=1 Tax=marine sediment metagenome TaxID=412755 RepID=A0A0F9UN61_9ZZZZ|nr:RNA polymerase sigma factor [Candidatus Nealsonbacteria bacterium]HEB46198.1 RNA polymerase sigma factor [Candidatus Nealsonbacteria bacterium]
MDNHQKHFSQLYDQHIDKIYRFVFLKVSSQEVAEDLTSETFLRGWRVFKNGEKEIVNPSAFLYQIARNLVTDFYREKGKTQIVSTEFTQIKDPRIDLEEKALMGSDMDTVKLAISGLKEDYQNVVIWHYLDDLSVPEIAKIIDKPEGTIRVMLHRALKALKSEIKEA